MAATPLNALHAFLSVARHLSYAAAAKDLGISSSALSQSVRQLEGRLGVVLLTRTSRGVALTDAGRRLLQEAGPAVAQALESLKTVRAERGEVTGRVKLTVPVWAVSLVLARVAPAFLARYPKVELDVRVEDRFVNVVEEGLDAGIRLMESIDRDMVSVRLFPATRIVVTAAPSYLEKHGAPQKPADLLSHECLCIRLTPEAKAWTWELGRGRRTWRVPVRGPLTTNSTDLLETLALAGAGLHYCIEDMVAPHIAAGRLKVVLEAYAPDIPGLFLYYPSRSSISPALKAFVEVAREITGPKPVVRRGRA